MGPGGYKFSDYARLGAPLSVAVDPDRERP